MDPAQASFDVICGSSAAIVPAETTVFFDGIAVNGRYGLGDVFDWVDIGLKNMKTMKKERKLI